MGTVQAPARRTGRHAASRRHAAPRTGAALSGPVVAVLFAASVCAACGLVYELVLVAVADGLFGSSVRLTSLVLSVMVFAMGVGSLLTKPLRGSPHTAFALVEAALALLGGLSAPLTEHAASDIGLGRAAPVVLAGAVGVLVGTEIPLLLAVVESTGRGDLRRAATDVLAADYLGALLGGLAFPFLLVPLLGTARGAVVAGACNAVAGLAVLVYVGRAAGRGRGAPVVAVLAVGLLAIMFPLLSGGDEHIARPGCACLGRVPAAGGLR